jgi:TatD DNase family protein
MHLTDTHTHLYLPNFSNDIDKVIERAVNTGITKMFLPNIDIESISSIKKLTSAYPENCFPMMGLHPASVDGNFENDMKLIEDELITGKYYAVGETGIDLYWDKKYKNEQIISFQRQIELSREHKLPLIIHARESFNEIFTVLKDYKNSGIKGIFHAFTGTVDQANHIINEFGFKLGIGGIVTFKNSGLDKVVKDINIEHIVLETDSPFLAPVPRRGRRNESSYLFYIAEKIAGIYKLNPDKVAEITTQNAKDIFGI